MNKSLYFIELTCIKDCSYPNVEFHVGDVLYYNKKASSNEMHLYNNFGPLQKYPDEVYKYRPISTWSYLPFTRKKEYAKKWQQRRYAECEAKFIDKFGEFKCEIKEIKVTYTEEEV